MNLTIDSKDSTRKILWNELKATRASGGFSLAALLPVLTTYLLKGAPLSVDYTTRTAHVVKTAKVIAGSTTTATKVSKNHLFKIGDVIAKDFGKLCPEFWIKIQRLKNNYNEQACWLLLTENIEWILNCKEHYKLDFDIITTVEIMSWFFSFELEAHNIHCTGETIINNDFAIGLGSAKIKATGHSKMILIDNSSAECYDTSFVSGYNQSSFVVYDCIGNAFH